MVANTGFRAVLIRWGFLVWNFVDSWIASIPWRRFAYGAPFLGTMLCLVVLSLFGGNLQSGLRSHLVKGRTERAMGSGDWQTAKLLLFRLTKADPENANYRFQLALAHHAIQETDQAVHIVRKLVFIDKDKRSKDWDKSAEASEVADDRPPIPANRFRFRGTDPRFLLWMVEHVYNQTPWEELDAEDQDNCLAMLATLHMLAPGDLAIAQLYAQQLLRAGRYPDALPVLVSLIPTAPGIGLRAAIIARKLRLFDKATAYAEESRDRFRVLVQQKPESAELAVALSRCQVFLGQHAASVRTIDQAIILATDEKTIGVLLGIRVEAIVAWADAMQSQPKVAIADRLLLLRRLEEALGHSPNQPQLLQMVISHVLAVQDEDDKEVSDARQALVNGVSPGLAHFIHGTAATIDGRKDEARTHLELAAKAFPDSDVILNNLAHVLSQGDGDNLLTALTLANTAIERSGNPTAYHYDTRGRILHKLGRWLDAVSDLQHAIKEPQLAHNAHRMLSDCYQQLGLSELAVLHATVADQTTKPEPPATAITQP